MIILVDTNVVLDVLMKREPYTEAAQHILTKCANREIVGYLAAHSIPNLFYILRKAYSQKERRKFIKNLCDIFRISDLNAEKIMAAAENEDFSDFEDCLQDRCAVSVGAKYIITRNTEDFTESQVPAISPESFLNCILTDCGHIC